MCFPVLSYSLSVNTISGRHSPLRYALRLSFLFPLAKQIEESEQSCRLYEHSTLKADEDSGNLRSVRQFAVLHRRIHQICRQRQFHDIFLVLAGIMQSLVKDLLLTHTDPQKLSVVFPEEMQLQDMILTLFRLQMISESAARLRVSGGAVIRDTDGREEA